MVKSGSEWGKVELNMFRGINFVNMDTKGRITMPARYRAEVLDRLVVTIDTQDRCLLLYPFLFWEEIERKIDSLPSFNQTTRRIQRLLIGHATELDMDGNGRILLPPLLREYAGLKKDIMLIGQGKKFELWDKATWTNNRDLWLDQGLDEINSLPQELQLLSL